MVAENSIRLSPEAILKSENPKLRLILSRIAKVQNDRKNENILHSNDSYEVSYSVSAYDVYGIGW